MTQYYRNTHKPCILYMYREDEGKKTVNKMILYTGKVPYMIFIKAASVQRRSQMFDTHHLFLRNSMP